jgi:hypothetical protein
MGDTPVVCASTTADGSVRIASHADSAVHEAVFGDRRCAGDGVRRIASPSFNANAAPVS